MFKTNVGAFDRIFRMVIGVALLGLFFLYPDASWRNFTLIGIIPILTAIFSTCPLYTVLGMSTCPMKRT